MSIPTYTVPIDEWKRRQAAYVRSQPPPVDRAESDEPTLREPVSVELHEVMCKSP